MGKLFDSIVLEEQQDSLFAHLIQFGLKKKASTVVFTSLLKETIGYYNENNTDCYLLLLPWMLLKLFIVWSIGNHSILYAIEICVH